MSRFAHDHRVWFGGLMLLFWMLSGWATILACAWFFQTVSPASPTWLFWLIAGPLSLGPVLLVFWRLDRYEANERRKAFLSLRRLPDGSGRAERW